MQTLPLAEAEAFPSCGCVGSTRWGIDTGRAFGTVERYLEVRANDHECRQPCGSARNRAFRGIAIGMMKRSLSSRAGSPERLPGRTKA